MGNMIACICGGIGEYGIVMGIVSVASCIACWIKRVIKRHKDCECECHRDE